MGTELRPGVSRCASAGQSRTPATLLDPARPRPGDCVAQGPVDPTQQPFPAPHLGQETACGGTPMNFRAPECDRGDVAIWKLSPT